MSLNYTYHKSISFLLAAIVAWNSFGYIGMMLGSLAMQEMHHGEEQCEKVFCYCEVSDGMKVCVCHHHNERGESEEHHNNPTDCFLDLDIKDFTHSSTLIQWDSRTFILYDSIKLSTAFQTISFTLPPGLKVKQGEIQELDRPPALV